MRIAISAMGTFTRIACNLYERLQAEGSATSLALYVSDSSFFTRFQPQSSILSIHRPDVLVLKEWEVMRKARETPPQTDELADFERRLGDPTLWNALLADRRIYFGKSTKFRQDYQPRFNHDQMLSILGSGLREIDALFKASRPELVLNFGVATFGDYLFYLFARANGIPYLQLSSTKVRNHVILQDCIRGIPSVLSREFENAKSQSDELKNSADTFLAGVRQKGLKYEGDLLTSTTVVLKRLWSAPMALAKGSIRAWRQRRDPVMGRDNHLVGELRSAYHLHVRQPLRLLRVSAILRRSMKRREELASIEPYLFYPLHFEPEVALQVYGRPFQNQIELIRLLALNVPVGMKVVVKEHPRSLGFRPAAYYRKILEIPNVLLADAQISSIELVSKARIVAVLSGVIGLEACILGKPVLTLGKVPYNLLNGSMLRHVSNVYDIGEAIRALLNEYQYDDEAIRRYVMAVLTSSVPIDLYSVLLAKANRFSAGREDMASTTKEQEDYQRLAKYVLQTFQSMKPLRQASQEAEIKA